jgi:hypothetical protein
MNDNASFICLVALVIFANIMFNGTPDLVDALIQYFLTH